LISKITPDRQKAIALCKMAEVTLERLDKTDKKAYPSNTLVDYYEILHKYLEGISFLLGYKVRGEGAHKELIDFVAKECRLSEQQRLFLQKLRDYRNRISYEGFIIQQDFINVSVEKINLLIVNLQRILNEKVEKRGVK
jgi:hypothetical protein